MKICILITAHKNACQLERLVNHLKKDFDIYLHIDKKSKIELHSSQNVYVYKKFNVEHGGFNQITTTLFLLEEAHKNNYDRYIFISGQDVPLVKNKRIIEFFEQNKEFEYLTFRDLRDCKILHSDISRRMNHYNFGKLYRLFLHAKIRGAISNISFFKRELPSDTYWGSNWWNLTGNAIDYILDFVKSNQAYLNRYKYTWGGDEIFFQSVLMSSQFSSKCVNKDFRFLHMQGAPKILLMEDYEDMKKSECFFARKFDMDVDNNVIDKLYSRLENDSHEH